MIRAWLRGAALLLWILVASPVPLLIGLVTLGNRRVTARTGPFFLRILATGICRVLGIRITRRGEPLPRGACLVAPNHWGYIDILVLGSLYRGAFVSRADVADWPLIGVFARLGGTLFVVRERKKDAKRVGGEIEERLRAGRRVTTFLEGGSGRGDVVRPFKSPLVEAAVVAGAPCVPVAIRYTLPRDPDLDPNDVVAWIDQPFGAHLLGLLKIRRIDASVTFLPTRTGTDRKELAKSLEDDVSAAVVSAPARSPDPRACTR